MPSAGLPDGCPRRQNEFPLNSRRFRVSPRELTDYDHAGRGLHGRSLALGASLSYLEFAFIADWMANVSMETRLTEGAAVCPRVKVWLEKDHKYVFGHGIAEILSAIKECGSIKEASRRVGKSYRYVWGRIKEAEETFQVQLVETRVGGGDSARSSVTPFAERLLGCFVQLRAEVISFTETRFVECYRELQMNYSVPEESTPTDA